MLPAFSAPPPEPARPDPERFNGFTPSGAQPDADNGNGGGNGGGAGDGRYRSLRQMSADAPLGEPAATRTAAPKPELPASLRGLAYTPPAERPTGWTRRRLRILGVLAAVVVIVLGVGGYAGYKFLAPYYGLGYNSGGTATLESVKLTVTKVRCGLSNAPFGNSGTPQGVYCAVTVSARNRNTQSTAWVNQRTWNSTLDVGLTVPPVAAYLPYTQTPVPIGESATFQLTYDIPSGARMTTIRPKIDNKQVAIAVS